MRKLDTIKKDSFLLDRIYDSEIQLAITSLRIALRAYFSTYQTFKYRLHIFNNQPEELGETVEEGQKIIDYNHGMKYAEMASECIVHFQHFAELICKSILRHDHPLLALDVSRHPKLLHKLLRKKKLADDEWAQINSGEFSESLKRLMILLKDKQLRKSDKLECLLVHENALKCLNELRNRVWHRGLYVLRYPALDELIGGYVLPFVKDVFTLPYFKSNEPWQHGRLACGISPADEIIKEAQIGTLNIGKVAFLKELGRAAFENPIKSALIIPRKNRGKKITGLRKGKSLDEIFGNRHRLRAERIAHVEAAQDFSDIRNCPVCGIKALIVYKEMDSEESEDGETLLRAWRYTHAVTCENCSFNIEGGGIENASVYKLTNIEDYWTTVEL